MPTPRPRAVPLLPAFRALARLAGHADMRLAGDLLGGHGDVRVAGGHADGFDGAAGPGAMRATAPEHRLLAVPDEADGWIASAIWTNETRRPISLLESTWRVPPAPANNQSDQTVYLFNGLGNYDGAFNGILQPVLQWGVIRPGGDPCWSVASWYVLAEASTGASGLACRTPSVPVNEGDELVGVMSLVPESAAAGGPFYEYRCEFRGIPESQLIASNVPFFAYAYETLESYAVEQPEDYPDTASTTFRSIRLEIDGQPIGDIPWERDTQNAAYGEHVAINDPTSAGHGEVEIFYRP